MASSTNSHEKFRMGPNWFVLVTFTEERGKAIPSAVSNPR